MVLDLNWFDTNKSILIDKFNVNNSYMIIGYDFDLITAHDINIIPKIWFKE